MLITPTCPASWRGKELDQQELAARKLPSLLALFRKRGAFSNVDDATINELERHMVTLEFKNGEILCREGTAAEWTFVIVTGQSEVVRAAPDGTLILVNVLQPGDWGGIMALVGKGTRLARLLARGDTVVRAIDHDSLVRLMDRLRGLSAALLDSMGQRIRDDTAHLSATLQHVRAVGLDDIAEHCSPHERLMLDTIRHRVAAAESLSQIMDFVFATIPADGDIRMTLAFLEDLGGRVVSYWSRANYEPLLLPANYEEDLDGSLMEPTYRNSTATTVDDLEDFACHHPFNQGAVKRVKEGLCSCMISPLKVGSRVVGFLMRSSRKLAAFDEHEMLIQQAIADSISPVVEKAYRIEMLTKANNDYSEVLSFISHELQSPIASIVTDARLLEEGYLGDLNDKQKEKIGRSIKKGEYLLRMIRSFLNVARIESGTLDATMSPGVNVRRDVIQPEVELLQSECESKGMAIQVIEKDTVPEIDGDTGLLRIAVGNLLRNAIAYGREDRDIRLTVGKAFENDEIDLHHRLEPGTGIHRRTTQQTFPSILPAGRSRFEAAQGNGDRTVFGLANHRKCTTVRSPRAVTKRILGRIQAHAADFSVGTRETRFQSCRGKRRSGFREITLLQRESNAAGERLGSRSDVISVPILD